MMRMAQDRMTADLTLHEAGPGDFDTLIPFYRQLVEAHGATRSPVQAVKRLTTLHAAGHRFTLFRRGETPVGAVTWIDLGDHIFIRHFTIDRALRGQGLGAAGFAALRAAHFPGREVELSASVELDAPLKFWTAQGFYPVGHTLRLDSDEDE